MKVSARDVGSFLETPPNNIRAYLIFGRDLGLISERVLTLTSSIIGNIGDPFRFSELTGKEIAAEPARFIDEVSALSLVGGKRVVRVRLGSENISDSLKVLFDGPGFESLVILEGSNLANTSPVRRLMEKHDMAAVIPCYEDNVATLSLLIDQIMTQNSINLSQAAKEYLLTHLGSDRQVSRRELEKLVTFTGEKHAVSIDDVLAIIDDNGFFSIEEIVYKVASYFRTYKIIIFGNMLTTLKFFFNP